MTSYRYFMTESGDDYYIPSEVYDEQVNKYRESVATDWVWATKAEQGQTEPQWHYLNPPE